MQEAWLLFDEVALREAAGNPRGRQPLELPRLRDVEQLPDPKADLHRLLWTAQGEHIRRRRRVTPAALAHRVAELIEDFAPLRAIEAFAALEHELADVIEAHGWS